MLSYHPICLSLKHYTGQHILMGNERYMETNRASQKHFHNGVLHWNFKYHSIRVIHAFIAEYALE